MKLRSFVAAVSVGLGLTGAAVSAHAGPLALDQWYTFGFGATGSALSSGTGFVIGQRSIAIDDSPWTFDCRAGTGGHCKLIITDGFLSGDEFQIFNFGIPIFSTPVVADIGADCGNDEEACLASSDHSQRTYILNPGAYSFSGVVTDSPFSGGAGFLKLVVPEPGGLALVGVGLLALGLRRRKS